MKSNWDTSVLQKYFRSTVRIVINLDKYLILILQGQTLTDTSVYIIPVHVPGHWKLGVSELTIIMHACVYVAHCKHNLLN